MRVAKIGLFWRILVDDDTVSKKRFLTSKGAMIYYHAHQDSDGFPVVKL